MATIRDAKEKDIPRILELYQQLTLSPGTYKKAPLEDCKRVFKKMEQTPGYSLFVTEENGEIIGTVVMVILPGFAHGTSSFAVLEYMVVDEKVRSKGIGRYMMEYCLTKARESGCYKIMLTSDIRREKAHQFYRSLGFEASAEGFRFYF